MSGVDVLPTLRGMADPNNEFHSEAVAAVAELIRAADAVVNGAAPAKEQLAAALANVTGGER